MEIQDLNKELAESQHQLHELLAKYEDSHATVGPELIEVISQMHEGELADVIDGLRPNYRVILCQLIPVKMMAEVIEELSINVVEETVKELPEELLIEIVNASEDLKAIERILRSLAPRSRSHLLRESGLDSNLQLLKNLTYAPNTVGELLDFHYLQIQSDATVKEATVEIKKYEDIPSHLDIIFAVNKKLELVGVVPIAMLLTNKPSTVISSIMIKEPLYTLKPEQSIEEATELFERYDLITVPVLSDEQHLLGRLTVDEIVFYLSQAKHRDLINASGVKEEEDMYAPLSRRLRNRGFWIFLNLIAAFCISRVVGYFEGTIVQVVALASLMPIIGNLAGNTGMQTATLVIRGLALKQVNFDNWHLFFGKELVVGVVNGVVWGLVVGLFGILFYENLFLGLVLMASMAAVFTLGAITGFLVPVCVKLLNKDPALGSAVVVTAFTDLYAFAIFLGLSSLILL